MVYKSINNLAPKYLCNLFTKNSSRDITLRNSELDLYIPFSNTKEGQKSLSYSGTHFWNGLKPTISAKSLGTFTVICAIDEVQNSLPLNTMLFKRHMTSIIGISDTFPNS